MWRQHNSTSRWLGRVVAFAEELALGSKGAETEMTQSLHDNKPNAFS
jgi:hypothetical protein